MNNTLLIILITICLASCSQQKNENNYVITQKYNEHYLKDTIKNLPYDFYTGNNIIIPEKSRYLYYHNSRTICGTGWKITNPPNPINFDRTQLIQFNSVTDLKRYLISETLKPRLVMIVSDSDTIRNPNYFKLIENLKEIHYTHVIATRKITNDEKYAISNSKFRIYK